MNRIKTQLVAAALTMLSLCLAVIAADAESLAKAVTAPRASYQVLEEDSHNGQAARVIGAIKLVKTSGQATIVFSAAGVQSGVMTAPVTRAGTIATLQPDIANAYNGAVVVLSVLPAAPTAGNTFTVNFRFRMHDYPDVTIPLKAIVQYADPHLVTVIGNGDVPGTSTLHGLRQAVALHGHFDIEVKDGALTHSAWSVTSETMNERLPPDTISWSIYAPGIRIPGTYRQ